MNSCCESPGGRMHFHFSPKYIKNSQKSTESIHPIRKWAKRMNRHSSKRTCDGCEHGQSCSASLATREAQIRTTVKHHSWPIRRAERRSCDGTHAGEWQENWGPPPFPVGVGNGGREQHSFRVHGWSQPATQEKHRPRGSMTRRLWTTAPAGEQTGVCHD